MVDEAWPIGGGFQVMQVNPIISIFDEHLDGRIGIVILVLQT